MTDRSALTANAERRTLDGRTHLVAPLVALVAGVINGELVTADELATFAEAWNGRPVPLRHPQDDYGNYISANSPDVIAASVIGQVFEMRAAGERLLGEIWLDEEKCRRMGGDALAAFQRLEQGEVLEVSTAYFCEIENAGGTFNGARYDGIQRNLRPDHVALLPDEVGACSVVDGCGAGRANAAVHLAESLSIQGSWRRTAPGRTNTVFDSARLVKSSSLTEETSEPASATVVNCNCSGGTMEEQKTQEAAVQANESEQQAGEIIAESSEITGTALPSELTELAEAVRSFGGVSALMDVVRSVKANSDREKTQVVERLAANSRCVFSRADLNAFTFDQLVKLDASLTPATASYVGRNGASMAVNAEADRFVSFDVIAKKAN